MYVFDIFLVEKWLQIDQPHKVRTRITPTMLKRNATFIFWIQK